MDLDSEQGLLTVISDSCNRPDCKDSEKSCVAYKEFSLEPCGGMIQHQSPVQCLSYIEDTECSEIPFNESTRTEELPLVHPYLGSNLTPVTTDIHPTTEETRDVCNGDKGNGSDQFTDDLLTIPINDYKYYKEIEDLLKYGTYPSLGSKKYSSYLRSKARYYLIKNGELYHDKKNPKKVIMTKEGQQIILKTKHLSECGGIHYGIKKMFCEINATCFWRGIYKDISDFVNCCPECRDGEDVAQQVSRKNLKETHSFNGSETKEEVPSLKTAAMTSAQWKNCKEYSNTGISNRKLCQQRLENSEDISPDGCTFSRDKDPTSSGIKKDISWAVSQIKNYLSETKDARRKRGKYQQYSVEMQEHMISYAIKHGAVKAAKYFTQLMGTPVSDSTIRNLLRTSKNFHPREKRNIACYAIKFGPEKASDYFSKLFKKDIPVHIVKKIMAIYSRRHHKGDVKYFYDEFSCASQFRNVSSLNDLERAEICDYSLKNSVEDTIECFDNKFNLLLTAKDVKNLQENIFHQKTKNNLTDLIHSYIKTPDNCNQPLNSNLNNPDFNNGCPLQFQMHCTEVSTCSNESDVDDPTSSSSSFGSSSPSQGKWRSKSKFKKRGKYKTLSPEMKAKIGKYAAEHGSGKASKYFRKVIGYDVAESTIRGLKDKYLNKVKKCNVTSLGCSQRGRPLKLGKYDEIVQECLREMVKSGEKMTTFLVITTAKKIITKLEPELLKENGGTMDLNVTWAKSFLNRISVRNNS